MKLMSVRLASSGKTNVVAVSGLTVIAAAFCMAATSLGVLSALAQAIRDTKPPRFEVASVRLSKPDSKVHISVLPDGYTATNIPLKAMISNAYGIRQDLISGAPGWTDSTAYDIEAKEDESTAAAMKGLSNEQRAAQIRLMLQALLADRFHLQITHSTKESPIYELVIAKGGFKLKDADPDNTYAGGIKGPGGITTGVMRTGSGQLIAQAISMQMLANNLQYQVGRTVVDKTGLTGKYDFTLKWAPDPTTVSASAGSESDSSGPSIFTALQEELGLKLEPTTGPVEILVVDHIEKPSEN